MAKTKAKSTSVKKSIKSNKNKKFSLKKLDFKKNWKKLSYLGLAGFLALSSVGYGVWRSIDPSEASAFQNQLTLSSNGASARLYICKKWRDSNVTTIGMFIRNDTRFGTNAGFMTNYQNSGTVGTKAFSTSQTAYYNASSVASTISMSMSFLGGGSTYKTISMSSLSNCW